MLEFMLAIMFVVTIGIIGFIMLSEPTDDDFE